MSYKTTTVNGSDLLRIKNSRGQAPRDVTVDTLMATINQNALSAGSAVNAVAATGSVIFAASPIPVADETLTINGDVYTFKATRAGAFEITIDASESVQGDNLVTAITADATAYTAVNAAGTVTITAAVKGVIGNAITLEEAATGTSVSGAVLTGGVDGTVGAAGDTLVDASYLYVAVAANTTADRNWRRIAVGSVY